MLRAVDASYDLLSPDEAACLKQKGWPIFIQCLLALPTSGPETPAHRVTNLRTAINANLDVGGYFLIGGHRAGLDYLRLARNDVPQDIWDALKFVAIDVETPGVRVEEVLSVVNVLRGWGKRVVYYTNYRAHTEFLVPNNSEHLAQAGVPLWNAYWDGDPDVDFARLQFGGWQPDQVAIEQWSGGENVCGFFVDRNTVPHPELLGIGGDDTLSSPEYRELSEKFTELDSRLGTALQLIESIRKGEATTPIWPVGDVPLTEVFHRGYTAFKLREIVEAAKETLQRHLVEHNTSGGPIDRYSPEHLIRMADLLDELEKEVRGFAEETG